jgi:hypothetical protein
LEKLGDGHFGAGRPAAVRSREIGASGELVRHGDYPESGVFRGGDPVRRVFEGERFVRSHTEELHRVEIQVGSRLRAGRVFAAARSSPSLLAPSVDAITVERRADQRFQMAESVEPARLAADVVEPPIAG